MIRAGALTVILLLAGCAGKSTRTLEPESTGTEIAPAAPPSIPEGRGVPPPTVLPRADWNAAPIDSSKAVAMERVTRLTVHHTGEGRPTGPGGTIESYAKRMRAYQRGHQQNRGWADIGYHFVIDPDGRIWQARELRWQGAHAGNHESNRFNVGISLMGNFEIQELSTPQTDTLLTLVRWLMDEYAIPKSELYTHREIKKKYDLSGTACPGARLFTFFVDFRSAP